MAKHGRGRTNEPPAGDPLPLSLSDVYLLTAQSDGQLAVGGLALTVDHQGLTVFAPDGRPAATLPWSELTVLRAVGRTTAPGGGEAVLLEASSHARSHRFIVPTGDADNLESTLSAITGVPAPDTARRSRRR